MVLQNAGLPFGSKGAGDVLAFFLSENNAPEISIDAEVVVEDAGVLRGDVDRLTEYGPCFPLGRVTMGCCLDIWTSLVDGRVWVCFGWTPVGGIIDGTHE